MLITKFNRMIRNRLLWGIFAVGVCASFVLSFSAVKQSSENTERFAGVLNGQKISYDEFLRARFFETKMRDSSENTSEDLAAVNQRCWKRILALKTAEKLGITATDEEIKETISRDPAFKVNDTFNREKYRQILASIFRDSPDVERLFEDYLRQAITIQKLAGLMSSAVWVPDTELNSRLSGLADTFVLQYVHMKASDFKANINTSLAEARSFYDKDPSRFKIPDMVSVRYVEFPITNYSSAVVVDDAAMKEYYEANLDQYSQTGTNGESTAQSFDEVKEKIRQQLVADAAANAARDAATEFALRLTPDRAGRAISFEDAAKTATPPLEIHTTSMFSATDQSPVQDAGPQFIPASFALDPSDTSRYFSDPIMGEKSVYVTATNSFRAAYQPDFDKISDAVIPMARSNALQEAFAAEAFQVREKIATMIGSGKPFSKAVKELGMDVSIMQPFSVYQGLPSNETAFAQSILPVVGTLEVGQVSKVLPTDDGALVVYVEERTPADPAMVQLLAPRLRTTLERYRSGTLYEDFADYQLAQAKLQDSMKSSESDSADEETR